MATHFSEKMLAKSLMKTTGKEKEEAKAELGNARVSIVFASIFFWT
jgi:hypothetical protein